MVVPCAMMRIALQRMVHHRSERVQVIRDSAIGTATETVDQEPSRVEREQLRLDGAMMQATTVQHSEGTRGLTKRAHRIVHRERVSCSESIRERGNGRCGLNHPRGAVDLPRGQRRGERRVIHGTDRCHAIE